MDIKNTLGLDALPAGWPVRARAGLIVALLWGSFVSLMAIVAFIDIQRIGQHPDFGEILRVYAAGFFPWLLLGPLNFQVARSLGTHGKNPRQLLLAALVASVASLVLIFLYIIGIYAPLHGMGALEVLQQTRLVDFVWDGILFLTIFLTGVIMGSHQLPPSEKPLPKRVAIKSSGRIDYIDITDVLAVSARSNYVELFCDDRSHLHRSTLKEFIEGYTDGDFVKIHRSHLVRPEAVSSIRASGRHARQAVLTNGTSLPIAKGYWDGISEKFAAPS